MIEPVTKTPVLEQEAEVDIIAWVASHLYECIVDARTYTNLVKGREHQLFEYATYDDVAFLILLVEDSFKMWIGMAKNEIDPKLVTKGKNGEEVTGRKKFKLLKKFSAGNGLSSVGAQKRYHEIRNGISRYAKNRDMMEALEEGYQRALVRYLEWRKEMRLDPSTDDNSSSKQPAVPVLPEVPALDDDLADHMLADLGDDVGTWAFAV